MPLIVANRPCNKTKTSLLEIECTEMKDKYRMTVVKTAAVNDSLGTAFFRWTSPFNTTSILDTYQLPKVEGMPTRLSICEDFSQFPYLSTGFQNCTSRFRV